MFAPGLLTDRVAIITGGGTGIGLAIARTLGSLGARIAIASRGAAHLERGCASLAESGVDALAVQVDVRQPEQVDEMVERTVKHFGGVDILVNNAGDNVLGRIDEQDPEVWWQQIVVGLRGPYTYSRAVVPMMRAKKWGRIINISSVNGKKGAEFCTAYCSAKHGIIGFTRALALEVAKAGITVNAVCPGLVMTALTERTFTQRTEMFGVSREVLDQMATKQIPQGAPMTPEDVAHAVAFLASDAASRITGESLNVSSGQVMH